MSNFELAADLPLLAALILVLPALMVIVGSLSDEAHLYVALALAVPQMHLAFTSFPLPVFLLWVLLAVPSGLTRFSSGSKVLPWRIAVGLVILSATYACFSIGHKQGLYVAVQYTAFAMLIATATRVWARSPNKLVTALGFVQPFVLLEVFLTVLFRLSPNTEQVFLRSIWARIVAGDYSATHLYTDAPNNVLDGEKSGGVFLNGNVASLFLGLSLCMGIWVWENTRRRRHLVFAFICAIGVLATGSKTGIVACVATIVLISLAPLLVRASTRLATSLLIICLAGSVTYFVTRGVSEQYLLVAQSNETLGIRLGIWSAAWRLFADSPMLGLGFGGWEFSYGRMASGLGLSPRYPPHNVVIQAWAQLGIAGALLAACFFATVLRASATKMLQVECSPGNSYAPAAVLAALAWVLVHGMGDNTSIFGDSHTMPLVAVFVAVAVVTPRQLASSVVRDGGINPHLIEVPRPAGGSYR